MIVAILSWLGKGLVDSNYGVNGKNLNQNCNFVRAAYLALLNREPDPQGLDAFCALLKGGATKKQVLDNILKSNEYQNIK